MAADGEEYVGRSYKAVVQAMAAAKMTSPSSRFAYRRQTAARVAAMYEREVRHDTDKNFIIDLEAAGLLKRMT